MARIGSRRPTHAGDAPTAKVGIAELGSRPQLTQREQTRRSLDELREQIRQLPEPDWVYAATTHFSPEGQFRPTGGRPRIIHVLARGEVNQPRQQVGPSVLPLAADDPWQLPDGNEMSDGQRRAALARWLTDPEHPLVWRSIVNRVWQYHFGQGLVATPNDFGRMGAQPTHPDLLDWLACEFRDRGKSLKALHRLIVTSNVYRQSSADNPEFSQIDASNQWLWRMNRRRLEAEEIRDAILQVSGSLDRQMGGPGFYLFELEKASTRRTMSITNLTRQTRKRCGGASIDLSFARNRIHGCPCSIARIRLRARPSATKR